MPNLIISQYAITFIHSNLFLTLSNLNNDFDHVNKNFYNHVYSGFNNQSITGSSSIVHFLSTKIEFLNYWKPLWSDSSDTIFRNEFTAITLLYPINMSLKYSGPSYSRSCDVRFFHWDCPKSLVASLSKSQWRHLDCLVLCTALLDSDANLPTVSLTDSLCVFILALACETWPLYVMQFTKIFTP